MSQPHDPFGSPTPPPAEQPVASPVPASYPYGTAPPRRANGLGLAAMILGIVGLVLSLVLVGIVPAVVAVVLGVLGRRRVRRGEADNGGQALVGIITGVSGIVVAVIVGVVLAVFVNTDSFQNYLDCVHHASGQRAKQDCADQFGRSLTG